MRKVILSTSLLLEEGDFRCRKIDQTSAKFFATQPGVENFVQHSSVRILGILPAEERKTCLGYDEAIVIKPRGRLDFGKEYSLEELEKIGFDFFRIVKLDEI
jgi:hypothetical protein